MTTYSCWPVVPLSEVSIVGPRDQPLLESSPFVPMDAVEVHRRYPSYFELRGKRAGARAKANDVLFARITPCLENGKVAQLPADSPPAGGSTELLVVRPGSDIDPAFLYYWCQSPEVRERAKRSMTGTTGRMRLSKSDLARFPIPVPSLREQRKVVDILEGHLSRLDATDAGVASMDQRTSLMVAASAAHQVASSVALSDVSSVGARSRLVEYGSSSKTSTDADSNAIPVLRMGNIKDGAIDWTSLKYLPHGHSCNQEISYSIERIAQNWSESVRFLNHHYGLRLLRPT